MVLLPVSDHQGNTTHATVSVTLGEMIPGPVSRPGVDQTAELQAWWNSGSALWFPPGAVYTCEGQLNLIDRHGVWIEGNGAEIHAPSLLGDLDPSGKVRMRRQLYLESSSEIMVRNLAITSVGTGGWDPLYEAEAAVFVKASRNVTFENPRIVGPGGDGFEVSSLMQSGCVGDDCGPTVGLRVLGGSVTNPKRMGFSITGSARDVLVDGTKFWSIGRSCFDLELVNAALNIENVTIQNTTVDRFNLNWFGGGGGGTHDGVNLIGNVTPRFKMKWGSPGAVARRNFLMQDNVATDPRDNAYFSFLRGTGLTFRGNQADASWDGGPSFAECLDILEEANSWPS